MNLLSLLLVATFYVSKTTQAFSTAGPGVTRKSRCQTSGTDADTNTKQSSTTQLQAGLFGNLFGKKEEEAYDPSVPKRIMDIKCDSIKSGGLRFALGLFFIGQQGTPVKGSWKANQASDGVLDMYYVDNSAMFSVHLTDKLIFVDRYGQPSLQYQLQESLILHRFLDELQTLAFEGDDIEQENRLVVLSDVENGIEDARTKLPARQEQ
mmetsp:Transcript_14681/g.22243  ORF Transcript_14681/g.22243 Transcript_14681/m.22243 type:complete len:208 (+) Transcript_14681:62-685(+)